MKFSEYPFKMPNVEKLGKKISSLTLEFANAPTSKDASKVIKRMNRLMEDMMTDITIISVRYSLDARDEKYEKASEQLNKDLPLLQGFYHDFQKALISSPHREALEKEWGSFLFKMIETSMRCFNPIIIPELQKEAMLVMEYNKVIAGAKIPFRGEIYNLSQMGKFTQSQDRKTRKEAYLATTNFFSENDEKLGEIYDGLVKIRHEMATKLGFKNYIELGYLRLGRTDYNADDVRNYRVQIFEHVVPLVNKIVKQISKRIGIRKPYIYDLNQSFKDGNPLPKGDEPVLVKNATKMYDEMSKETGEFFRFMVENELLDLTARPGKRSGGYMTYFPRYKAPFIFANFNGTQGDVDVLTHEVGHAFQGYMSRNMKVSAYRQPTLEACEIHSMSMEFFAWPWMELFFEEADKYRLSHLEGAIKFLPYGVSVDEFQEGVYLNPELTHKERKALWREIEKKYLPFRNYEGFPFLDEGGFWTRQGHIFSNAFYYIDYTLAQISAFQFANEMWKNRAKAWQKYVKLCKLGGKYPYVELLKKAKLYNPFKEGTIKKVINPLKRKLKELNQ